MVMTASFPSGTAKFNLERPPEAHAEILPQAKSLTSRLWRFTAFKMFCLPPAAASAEV
jgi:hypothetical protein